MSDGIEVPVKVHDGQVRGPRFADIVNIVFFIIATLLAAWFALVLLGESWSFSLKRLLFLVPFWAVVAYLVLPRVHMLMTQIYVPSYFIGRARTSDGLLGDPINLAFDGTAKQIHQAMTNAGWTLADDVTLRSSWGIIVSSVFRRSYPEAPVSPLMVFGRMQCLAYQQEVDGNAAQRHHVRFWRCPDGWLLPGGRRVQWVAAGTYDTAVGLSLFTLQVTHRIDANIDIERDYIVHSVSEANAAAQVGMIENFSTGYHSRNGGGDRVVTDGNLPVVDVSSVELTEDAWPMGVQRAALGYLPIDPGGLAKPDPDSAGDSYVRKNPRPRSLVAGVFFSVLIVILGAIIDYQDFRTVGGIVLILLSLALLVAC